MIIFLTLLLIALIIGYTACRFYSDAVPFLAALTTPLLIALIIAAFALAVIAGIKIYKEFKKK